MTKRVRVAVVGAGWAGRLHLEAFRRCGEAELVGIHSRTRATAEKAAADFGVPLVCDSLAELLDRAQPDIVTLASPPAAHADQCLEVVRAGRHVLCDKPVALDAGDAERMWRAAEGGGVVHATGFIWRGDPGLARLRRLIRDGEVGRVLEVHSTSPLGTPVLPMTWMYEEAQGGGALMQHGSHVVDRLRWLLGAEYLSVHGHLHHDVRVAVQGPRFHDITDAFAWSREHDCRLADGEPGVAVTADTGYGFDAVLTDGIRARVWESWHSAGPVDDQVVVFGTAATMVWSGGQGLFRHRIGQPPEAIPIDADMSGSGVQTPREFGLKLWADLAENVVEHVRAGASASAGHPTLEDGLQVARVIDAVRRSHQSDCREAVR